LPVTRYVRPAPPPVILSQPRTVYTAPVSTGITYAAPNVRLAGPPIRPTVVRRTITVEPAPIVRAERVMAAPADCPAGTTLQSDGSCLERTVSYTAPAPSYSASTYSSSSYSAPVISQPYVAPEMADCPAGTTKQSDGTCMERSYSSSSYSSTSYSTPSYSTSSSVTLPDTMVYGGSSYSSAVQSAACPTGTTKQSDGTCLSSAVTSYTPSYSSSSVATSYRAPKMHKKMHHKAHKAMRVMDEYCYAGGSKRYDSLGNEIKMGSHDNCRNY